MNTRDEQTDKLLQRKLTRLRGYDYSTPGYYFITICTKDKQSLFWKEKSDNCINPQLSEYGKIADEAINSITSYYPNVKIDKYVIMDNHIHMILIIMVDDDIDNVQMISAPTIMRVVGQMKRWISKQIGFSIWQKSFYEHIIRSDSDYKIKAEYIMNNPLSRNIKMMTSSHPDDI